MKTKGRIQPESNTKKTSIQAGLRTALPRGKEGTNQAAAPQPESVVVAFHRRDPLNNPIFDSFEISAAQFALLERAGKRSGLPGAAEFIERTALEKASASKEASAPSHAQPDPATLSALEKLYTRIAHLDTGLYDFDVLFDAMLFYLEEWAIDGAWPSDEKAESVFSGLVSLRSSTNRDIITGRKDVKSAYNALRAITLGSSRNQAAENYLPFFA